MNINDVAFELFRIILLALVLERVLAAIYEIRWPFPKSANDDPPIMLGDWLSSGAKAIIAMICSIFLAHLINLHMLDVLQKMQSNPPPMPVVGWVDQLFSGLLVSGGSAAAIKLFQDVMGLGKATRDASREAQELEDQARKEKAKAELEIAKLQIETAKLRSGSTVALIRESDQASTSVPPVRG